MYRLKSEKGITMISIVVTIVILFILAGVGIKLGTSNLSSTENYKLTSELNMVQNAVLQQYVKFKTTQNEIYLIGEKISNEEVNNIANELKITLVNIPSTYSNVDYYKLNYDELEAMGIKKSTDEYIVNYVSGEVINITKKTLKNGEALYIRGNSFLNS